MSLGDNHIIVVGAGGAGLLSALRAAENGARVTVIERNVKPGIKLLISGGGKCNVTHAGTVEDILHAFPIRMARFLKPALHQFTNEDMLRTLREEGVETSARDNGRVFPLDGQASDVVDALMGRLQRAGARIVVGARVDRVLRTDTGVSGVSVGGEVISARRVLIATGGVSYPKTGTTGDGYTWARQLGHAIVPLRPALTPIGIEPPLPPQWRGIAIRDCRLSVYDNNRKAGYTDGDILFSHEGVTGPAALELSERAAITALSSSAELEVDMCPREENSALDKQLLDVIAVHRSRHVENIVAAWLPNRLVGDLLRWQGIDPSTTGHVLTAQQRRKVIQLLKHWRLGKVGLISIERGEVTAGGVSLDEVNPRTMESRLVPGLFLAGEVLDIDGPIGGYNLQAAFSTGVLAGNAMTR